MTQDTRLHASHAGRPGRLDCWAGDATLCWRCTETGGRAMPQTFRASVSEPGSPRITRVGRRPGMAAAADNLDGRSPTPSYKRPPIVEAVIEVRFAEHVDAKDLEGALSVLQSRGRYETHKPIVNVGVRIGFSSGGFGQAVEHTEPSTSHRLASGDETEILVLQPSSFAVSQLAPYSGWETFYGRFQRDWQTWKQKIGYRKIIRIATRYINRIDIPKKTTTIEETDYLQVHAAMAPEFGPMASYAVQASFPPDGAGCRLTLNSASVPSPLLGHLAIILDLDMAMDVNPPQKDADIETVLNVMRLKKNLAFEACLTDRARELFNQ